MKKKLMSAIALAMTMALTFGMTVMAADSIKPSDSQAVMLKDVQATIKEPEGAAAEALAAEAAGLNKIAAEGATVTVVTPGTLDNAKAVALNMSKNAKGSDATAKILAAADITVGDGGAATISFSIEGVTFDAAKTYIVMHLNGNVWETVPAIFSGNTVTATFKSFSPVVVVEVEKPVASSTPAAPQAPAESPKTGDVVSVAGMMAVICLAGAVVCAKKVRYSK